MKNVNKLTLEEVVILAEKMLYLEEAVKGGIEYYNKKSKRFIERALEEDSDDGSLAVKAVMYDGMKKGYEEILEIIEEN